ncbi:MAG: family 1 glycosylhydrolase [Pseudomonadota bacterium]|nr:family 1 glycosylhydrolase [Pseudomonadota bacterium]
MRKYVWIFIIALATTSTLSYGNPLEQLTGGRDNCTAEPPAQAPEGFMWGITAYHIPLPDYELYPDDFRAMAEIGIRWIRVDYAWKRIEPVRGEPYDFSYFDMVTQEAARNGIQIIGQIGNGYNRDRAVAPEWTGDLRIGEYLDVLDRYARAVVERYHDTIEYWSLENEINLDYQHVASNQRAHLWSPTAKMRIIHTLNEAVKQTDRSAKTVLSVVAVPGFLQFIARMRLVADYDFVGVYMYPAIGGPITEGFAGYVCRVITQSRYASGGKPVIVLETGFKTGDGEGRTPEAQRLFLRNMAEYTLRAGAVGFFWYEYLDNPNESQPRQRHSGLLEEDRSPKLSWFEYERVIRQYSP